MDSKTRGDLFRNLAASTQVNTINYVNRAKKYIYLGNAATRIAAAIKAVMYNENGGINEL